MAVIVPEGCRHVGWICEHEYIRNEDGTVDWKNGPYTTHRQANYGRGRKKIDRERGWHEVTNTGSSFDYRRDGDYRDSDCPYRVPVFVHGDEKDRRDGFPA